STTTFLTRQENLENSRNPPDFTQIVDAAGRLLALLLDSSTRRDSLSHAQRLATRGVRLDAVTHFVLRV
ncbi:MAG: hypothetical protein O2800_07925, partial [Planctomycetota bacterium]|nr:hypothetical protein [Planctomycetota bacterium]